MFRQQGFSGGRCFYNLDVSWALRIPGTWLLRSRSVICPVSYRPHPPAMRRGQSAPSRGLRRGEFLLFNEKELSAEMENY